MALTLTQVTLSARMRAPGPGGLKTRIVDATFDSSYPTNGETLVAGDLGLRDIIAVFDAGRTAGSTVHGVRYDHLNDKLLAYAVTGAEIANATNLASDTARLHVLGR